MEINRNVWKVMEIIGFIEKEGTEFVLRNMKRAEKVARRLLAAARSLLTTTRKHLEAARRDLKCSRRHLEAARRDLVSARNNLEGD